MLDTCNLLLIKDRGEPFRSGVNNDEENTLF